MGSVSFEKPKSLSVAVFIVRATPVRRKRGSGHPGAFLRKYLIAEGSLEAFRHVRDNRISAIKITFLTIQKRIYIFFVIAHKMTYFC